MFKTISKIVVAVTIMAPSSAFASEIGVSHTLSNSVQSGTGKLTVQSIKNIQVNEQSLSFTGQLSGGKFEYLDGGISGILNSTTEGDKDKDKDKDKYNSTNTNSSFSVSGVLGSGKVDQLSATLSKRNLSSTETIKSNLLETYSFSDSAFTQTSSTFSR